MVDGLTQLFYAKGLTHAQRVEVGKCIDAMNRPEVNIRGTDPDKVRHTTTRRWNNGSEYVDHAPDGQGLQGVARAH